MKTLITGGTIVTAADNYKGDVLVEDDKIALIGRDLKAAGAKRINATGKYVIPGGIDVHTHMELPFGGTFASDDFETGTRAAAFGGTTTIVDFAVQGMGEPLEKARDAWLKKARGKAVIDYGLHMIVRDVSDKVLREMDTMVREGVSSFKLFMAYPGVFMVDDASIFKALTRSAEIGGLICMHAENGGVIDVLVKRALAKKNTAPKWHALTRPPEAEGEATGRAFRLAEMAGGVPLYVVHLSAANALEQVRLFRDRGLPAYAETCPQYLFLSVDNYDEPGFDGAKYVMSPPLREKWHQEELWKGLARNDLQVISTDHCPFCMKEGYQGQPKQKELGIGDFSKIPNGAPGVETRMYLTYDGGVVQNRLTLNRWVEVTSTTPAKLMGMFPKKGTIAVGSDADIVVWDPRATHTISAKTHHMRVDYNPYEGRKVKGKPLVVMSRGEVIVEKDVFVGKKGRGRFIKRGSPIFQT
ncbi:MAG TPA: dihydropyrimidinase [Candidatus Limnocylindria bacterium]|jgi:dihydropyrimidinase|nr:dihydropyrimidinase [Candidatus Limnocylindria bacterium]